MKTLDLHHRIYIGLLTGLLVIVCASGCYFVANEREAILTQREFRNDLHSLLDSKSGLQGAVLERVDTATGVIEKQLANALNKADGQITATLNEVHGTVAAANQRTTDTLDVIRTLSVHADSQITGLRSDVSAQLTALNGSVNLLAKRYADLPDQIASDRVFKAYEANGLGLLAAAKLTMGQIEKTSKVVADEAPIMAQHAESLTKSADQIAVDVTREADQLTKPQSFWSSLRAWLLTIARIYGAI